ncbi:Hypothetical predicted protein [Xyrichtys novacula]|uniref:Uncharacterized protein n=1 Tax=Xyrichtys novacula TaxID=13765 RepID=A0AAV1GNI8_XYRNO|nr:Hypothetical predicted protein [Xyrichtys novacula]
MAGMKRRKKQRSDRTKEPGKDGMKTEREHHAACITNKQGTEGAKESRTSYPNESGATKRVGMDSNFITLVVER